MASPYLTSYSSTSKAPKSARGEEKAKVLSCCRMRCEVEVQGLDGIRHRVEVEANTLYEAAAKGVVMLKTAAFPMDVYPLMDITVKVFPPATLHVVRFDKLTAWIESSGAPGEVTAKQRLKRILAGE